MVLNNLEDRLECAIRHINTALDIDTWAQNLAVESMRMRIALMKGEQPDIIRCKDCKRYYFADNRIPQEQRYTCYLNGDRWEPDDYCSYAVRRTDTDMRGEQDG